MTRENIERTQKKLETMTKKWWFFLLFLFIQFIPPFVSKGYDVSKTGEIIGNILNNAVISSLDFLYPIFKIIPILLIISIFLFKDRTTNLFNVYVAISYVLFAFLQSVAFTEQHGLAIITSNLIMFLIVATFWFWEAIAKENDFTTQNQQIWKYWVVPLAFLALWMPVNSDTLMPDFDPIYLLTNIAGLTFCMMTPVYLAILTLYYPKVNITTLRVTSLAGTIIGLYNMLLNFLINPSVLWWNGVLHIPLLIISVYGSILSFQKD